MITRFSKFLKACKTLDNDGIYRLFEDGISQELRDNIIEDHADENCPEPTRSAMNALGEKFDIESLKAY